MTEDLFKWSAIEKKRVITDFPTIIAKSAACKLTAMNFAAIIILVARKNVLRFGISNINIRHFNKNVRRKQNGKTETGCNQNVLSYS